jgi:hypothetical protein
MPTRTDEHPSGQHDRDRQPGSTAQEEPRNFESEVSDGDRNYDAPFDADLNPTEDEDINTHGSDR